MIRAAIIKILGGTFEVRSINLRSGKNIPGTCLYKGSYFKARKVFKKREPKAGTIIRLQAINVLDYHIKPIDDLAVEAPLAAQYADDAEHVATIHDIGMANARQSEFMAKHQDEPNVYTGTDHGDHECDANGPWEFVGDTYMPTCSICEQVVEELDGVTDG